MLKTTKTLHFHLIVNVVTQNFFKDHLCDESDLKLITPKIGNLSSQTICLHTMAKATADTPDKHD